MTEDRLVGISDLAAILGRPQRTLGEWRNKQKRSDTDPRPVIPDTEIKVDNRGTLIWRASHVLAALTEAGRYDGPIPEPMDLPDLVSLDYVCERTGKSRRRVQWLMDPRAGTQLPPTYDRISGCPVWERATVDAWLEREYASA